MRQGGHKGRVFTFDPLTLFSDPLEDKMTALETPLEMSSPLEESTEPLQHDTQRVPDPQSELALTAEP